MKSLGPYKLFFFVFIAFVFITYLYFPALFSGFSTLVETNDGRFVAWDLSWDIHSLLNDPFHIFKANIFYPNPNTLSYSEHFIGTALWGIPVWLISGGNPAATFNFLMITGYVLNAFFTFLLIRKLLKNNMAAFLGAFINGFCSYRLWNIGHLQNVFIFYIPLCLWLFYKFLENRKTWPLIGLGICILLQSLSSWYHMIFLLLLISLFLLYNFFVTKALGKKDGLKIIIVIIFACLLVIPFAIPYLVQNRQNQTAYTLNDIISSDIGGYLLPPPDTFLNTVFGNYFGIGKTRWLENFNFIGYTPLLFCFFGAFKFYKNKEQRNTLGLRRESRLFLVIAIVFFIFSLGPYFMFNDKQTFLKLPYSAIFKFLSPIRFLRVVSRYATVVLLMTSILAAYGMANLFANTSQRTRRIISFLLLLLFVAEFTPMKRFNRFTDMSQVPVIYNYIRKDTSIKAMVELPINVDPFITTKYLYYAGIHFKPLVNGYSGYEPPTYNRYKTMFYAGIDEYVNSTLLAAGITHLLFNPEYDIPVNPNYAELILEKGGYKLFKLKPNPGTLVFHENILQKGKNDQTSEGPLKISRTLDAIDFNPADQYSLIANMSPQKINSWATTTYLSNENLNTLYIKFRTYSITDSMQVQCFKRGLDQSSDSLMKTYSYNNTSEFLEKFAVLDISGSNKIVLKLYATVFPDRTFITDLAFISKK